MLQEKKEKLLYEISLVKHHFAVNDYNVLRTSLDSFNYTPEKNVKPERLLIYFKNNLNLFFAIIDRTRKKPNVKEDEFARVMITFLDLTNSCKKIMKLLSHGVKKQPSYVSHKNAINLKSENRRILIFKPIIKKESDTEDNLESSENYGTKNIIELKSLTKNTTKKPGILHELKCNEKVKVSTLCLSDDALVELHATLGLYIDNIKKQEKYVGI